MASFAAPRVNNEKKQQSMEMSQQELIDGIERLIKVVNLSDRAAISFSFQATNDHEDTSLFLMVTLSYLEITVKGITHTQSQIEIIHKGRRANYIKGGNHTPHTDPLSTLAVLACLKQEAVCLGLILDRPAQLRADLSAAAAHTAKP